MCEKNAKNNIVPVLVPVPAERPYSYLVPAGMNITAGSIVEVPLGPRSVTGVVWDGECDAVDAKKLKTIKSVYDCPPIAQEMRQFIDWVADWTLAPPGMVIRMALSMPTAMEKEKPLPGFIYNGGEVERITKARARVIELANNKLAWTRANLAQSAGVSVGVVDGLIEQGLFDRVTIPIPPIVTPPDPDFAQPVLSETQLEAAQKLVQCLEKEGFSATLLDGVTGSGKTETYFEAIAASVRAGKQVLILLPEIALTQSFLDRFEDRFGARPAIWHSDLTPKTRERVWRGAVDGQVQVVAGARSALFLPFANLGLIIVDEEHDQAYKQEDRVYYNARDMAVVRAHLGKFPIILASATPSVESQVNVQRGRYQRVVLKGRYGSAELPTLRSIDMRAHPPQRGQFLSPILLKAMYETWQRGEQSLLFLNRRGYAPLTLCRSCGHRFQCPDCSSWLVEHRFRNQLVCHHCGHNEVKPNTCPQCGTVDHLVPCGPGVERIAEGVAQQFKDARVIVLSSDMAGGVKQLRLELDAIEKGEVDMVIGTQLVAKGHNFPKMTLVGVVDGDIGLTNGDPRAAERTFQLLSQVTGRAGRSGLKSQGLIQTYQPEHPVMKAIILGDRDKFYAREINEREKGMMPPFGRLAAVVISSPENAQAYNHARALRQNVPAGSDIMILGPSEAPLALIRGRYRYRLLIHGARNSDLQNYIKAMMSNTPKPRGQTRVQIDIDPQSFL